MKQLLDLFAKNSLKVSATAALTIATCFVPETAQAQFTTNPRTRAQTQESCNARQCTISGGRYEAGFLTFSFRGFSVLPEQVVAFVVPRGINTIRAEVGSGQFGGLFRSIDNNSRPVRVNLLFESNRPLNFVSRARYDLSGGTFTDRRAVGSSGTITAVPENPVGSLLGAGIVGAALLLKGRKRFKRLAQSRTVATPEQSSL